MGLLPSYIWLNLIFYHVFLILAGWMKFLHMVWSNYYISVRTSPYKTWCIEFIAKGHLPRVSCQSHLSVNDRIILRWYRGLCTDLLAFALQLRKISAKKPSIKSVRTAITSNGIPSLQIRSVIYHSTSGREKEGKNKNGQDSQELEEVSLSEKSIQLSVDINRVKNLGSSLLNLMGQLTTIALCFFVP